MTEGNDQTHAVFVRNVIYPFPRGIYTGHIYTVPYVYNIKKRQQNK